MSKASRRPGREEIKSKRKEVKQAQKLLRALKEAKGLIPAPKATRPNRMSPYETLEQQEEARTEAVMEHTRIIWTKLPILLKELSRIPDPRNSRMIVHKLSCLLIFGIVGESKRVFWSLRGNAVATITSTVSPVTGMP